MKILDKMNEQIPNKMNGQQQVESDIIAQNQTLSFSVEHCREINVRHCQHGLHQVRLILSHFTTLCLSLGNAISLRLLKVC